MAEQDPNRLYTPREVAELTKSTDVSVRRWIAAGELSAVRLGSGPAARYRVSGEALGRFLHPVEIR